MKINITGVMEVGSPAKEIVKKKTMIIVSEWMLRRGSRTIFLFFVQDKDIFIMPEEDELR